MTKTNKTFSPTIVVTKLAFDYLLKNTNKGDFSHKIPLPISIFSILIPDFQHEHGKTKKYKFVSDLYSNNLLRPFTSLQNSYPLTQKDYYHYTQLTHYLLRNPKIHIEIHPLICKHLSSVHTTKKSITLFYNLLGDKTSFDATLPLLKWEKDIDPPHCKIPMVASL